MIKNKLRKQNGFTIIELLIAFAIAAIFLTGLVRFSQTAITSKDHIMNQANAVNQAKNAFNYLSQDAQMAGSVITTNSDFPLKLSWVDSSTNTIINVVYSIDLNGNLQRIYSDSKYPANNSIMKVASNVNSAQTDCVWSNEDGTIPKLNRLTLNMTISSGSVNLTRRFIITPRVIQSSSEIANTISGSSSINPAVYGVPVTLTATITPTAVYYGTVTFLDNNNIVQIVPINSAQASCTLTNLSRGVHPFTAVYSGDATYRASTSSSWDELITLCPTNTLLTSLPISPSIYGQQVTFTASVTPSSATGAVTFYDNGVPLPGGSNIALDANGKATYTTSTPLVPGSRAITAVFVDSNGNYGTSTGALTQIVNNPVPHIDSIFPTSKNTGDPQFTLTINGTGFINNPPYVSVVNFKGTAKATTYVSATQLTAIIPASDLTTASKSPVTVVNPTPGGGTSNGVNLPVIGIADAAQSKLTVAPVPTNIPIDGVSTATLTVTAYDSAGNLTTNMGSQTVAILWSSGSHTGILSGVTVVGDGTFWATVTAPTAAGADVFVATLGGQPVKSGNPTQTQVTVNYVAGNTITITSNTNWSTITGGTGPGGQPSAVDKIIVGSNKTLTVDVATAVANTVTLGTGSGSGYQGHLSFNSGSQLIVGTLTRNSNQTCNVTMTNGGTLVVTTSMTTGLTLAPGTGSINFGGAGSQTLPSDIATYNNLATVGTVSLTLGRAITVNGTLTVSANTTFSTGSTNWTLGVTGTTSVYGTLTLANTATKTFTGDVTINSGGVWNETAVAAINYAGSFTNNATTFTPSTGTHTFTGTNKTISGSTTTSIPTVTFTGNYTNTGTLTSATLLTVTGASIRLTNNGTITATTALSGTGGVTQGAAGVLNIGGTSGITTLDAATNPGNTVNFNASGAQTVKTTTYSNLILSGSGVKTIGTATNGTLANGNLSIDPTGNATVSVTNKNIGVNTLTIAGAAKAAGSWGYGPSTPPTNKDTTHFASTTGYLTSAH